MPSLGRATTSPALPPVVVRYTGGNIAVASASWVACTSAVDLVVPAKAGDVVAIRISAVVTAVSNFMSFDYATWVSGAKVNMVSASQAPTNDYPLGSWNALGSASDYYGLEGTYFYTVQAGDLVAGQVTFRLHGRGQSATSRSLYAGVATFFYSSAHNMTQSVALDAVTSLRAITASATAAAGDLVEADATAGAVTVTLPSSPQFGSRVLVEKVDATVNAVILSSASLINGQTTLTLYSQYDTANVVWNGSTWRRVGAAGAPWRLEVNNPLTATTDFTAEAGTWALSGGVLGQTSAAATRKRYTYRGVKLSVSCIVEVECRYDASAAQTGAMGLTLGVPDAGGTGGLYVAFVTSTTHATALYYERDSLTAYSTNALAANIAHGTWITLRCVVEGATVTPYVNGTRYNSLWIDQATGQRPWLALIGDQPSSFRNLKVWTPVQP